MSTHPTLITGRHGDRTDRETWGLLSDISHTVELRRCAGLEDTSICEICFATRGPARQSYRKEALIGPQRGRCRDLGRQCLAHIVWYRRTPNGASGGSDDISGGRTESGEIYLFGAGPKGSAKISMLLLPDLSPIWTRGPLVAAISDIFIGYCARARAAQAVDQKLYFASTSFIDSISVSRNDDEWMGTNPPHVPMPEDYYRV